MSTVNFPIMYIPDPEKGRPIFKGKIFIGIPDLDPEIPANQKDVYYVLENGNLVSAIQPIETSSGGVPVYNGSPVMLDIDGNYSLKINNNLDAQVYYIPNSVPGSSGSGSTVNVEEPIELSAGQTTVVFTNTKVNDASIYVDTESGDRGKLSPHGSNPDYTITDNLTIELTNSFNAGTYCVGVSSEAIGEEGLKVRATGEGVSISDYNALVNELPVMESLTGNIYKFSNVDLSTEVAFDSLSGYYIPPASDLTGASGAWILLSGSISADASLTVGIGERHETLNSLMTELENITSTNKSSMVVTLKAGFIMSEQVLLYGTNLGWIQINSIDAEVVVPRSAMILSLGSVDDSIPVFGGIGSTLPVINVMFRMDTSGSAIARQDGLFVENGNAIILPGGGFQDFTEVGIYANSGSDITAESTNCSGSGVYGYFAFKTSSINCQSGIADNCAQYGLYINRSSQASANLAQFNNAGVNAVRVIRGSTLSWEDGVGTGATGEGIFVLNSIAQCLRADVSNSGLAGVYSHDSSAVDFRDGVAVACGGEATLWAFRCGTIDANNATLTGSLSTTAAVLVQRASNVNIQDADCSGSTATYGIRCSERSDVNAKDANAQKGGAPSVDDCSVVFGGTVGFDGGTGGTNITVNTITSQGIIFQ